MIMVALTQAQLGVSLLAMGFILHQVFTKVSSSFVHLQDWKGNLGAKLLAEFRGASGIVWRVPEGLVP